MLKSKDKKSIYETSPDYPPGLGLPSVHGISWARSGLPMSPWLATKHLSHFPFNTAKLFLSVTSIGKYSHRAYEFVWQKSLLFACFEVVTSWLYFDGPSFCAERQYRLQTTHGFVNAVKSWPWVSLVGSLSQAEESLSVHVFLLQKPFYIYSYLDSSLWLLSRSTPGNEDCTQYSRLGQTVDLCSSTTTFSALFSHSFPNNS